VALYHSYNLPWTPVPEEDQRLKRNMIAALVAALIFGLVVPFLPVKSTEKTGSKTTATQDRKEKGREEEGKEKRREEGKEKGRKEEGKTEGREEGTAQENSGGANR